jgi:pentatricopeptide repeat protein
MIARGELQQGRAIEAEAMFRATAEWVRAALPNDVELLAELLRDRLRVLRRIALVAAASREPSVVTMREVYDLAVERLAAQRQAGGPAALETLRAELDLAKVAMDCGAKAEGLARADAILASTERTLGACHSVRADTRAVRRSCLRALGRADEAADEAKRCIECVRASTSESSIELFAVRMDVLSMLDYAGRIAECEADARALAADIAALGAKFQPMKLAAEIHLARALSRQGRFDEAEAIFDRLVAAEEEFSWNSDRARLHAYRAGHLAARGRIEEARQAMGRSLELLPGEGRSFLAQEPDDRIVILIAIAEAAGDTAEAERYRAMQRSVLAADSSDELRGVRR